MTTGRRVMWGVVAAAAVVRLAGIRWGLPGLFEEATPMREAWAMWAGGHGLDLNPHFFNYPSLVIYIHLVAQWVLFAGMKAAGAVGSMLDFRALYAVDKTAFVLAARVVTAAFGVATVAALYGLVRRSAGTAAAGLAALLLCVNVLHISRSQMVEVDVPLTFFVVAALASCLALLDNPTRRRYIVTGVLVGLAASAKYTGALLVIPVLASHLLARGASRPRWTLALTAVGAAVVAFAVTSPFVLIDFSTFHQHLSIERYHMETGHFGLEGSPSWRAYAVWLGGGALGWPALVLGVMGLIYFAAVRRRPWAVVLAAFGVPYAVMLASWSMRAERYLLPLVPVTIAFAAAAVPWLGGVVLRSAGAGARRIGFVVVAVVLVAPLVAAAPKQVDRLKTDSRAQARAWIEANIPGGAFVVTEAYGPQLYGPYTVWDLDDKVRARVFRAEESRPYYAVQELPMYQVDPERAGVFYDMNVLDVGDVFVTTEPVRGRYERDPSRFSREMEFYRRLDDDFDLAAEFPAGDGVGPGVRVYRRRGERRLFSQRGDVAPPPALETGLPAAPGAQERFYFQFGVNYEAFNHYSAAYSCYEAAFRYSLPDPTLLADVAIGMARTLVAMGQRDRAVGLLGKMEPAARPGERERIRRFRQSIGGVLPR